MFCTECGTQYDGQQCGACTSASSQLELAGWWKRVGASLVDFLVLVPLLLVVGVALVDAQPIIATLVGFAIQFAYLSLMWTKRHGQTVGAKALRIRVVAADGSPMTPEMAYRRAAVLQLLNVGSSMTWVLRPLGQVALLLNVLWPLWDPQKQTLHDKAAGTIVVTAKD
ncbi:unannotated protein [freshwater metagenome]|uniref:Unannotated protein n=1 Tax=freshwater metagenome TaxID=449393 RepID=A0A6J7CKK5_9ZZZZ|nr:hypothetical protein [Actinomycetota bacterium]